MTAALRKSKAAANEVELCGRRGDARPVGGALPRATEDVLVVADLHLEKGSSFARRGRCCRPTTPARRCGALAEVFGALRAARRWWRSATPSTTSTGRTGSAAEEARDARGPCRPAGAGSGSRATTTGRCPRSIGGEVRAELRLGPLTFRHEPLPGATGEIAGHLHPAGKVVLRGRGVRRRCFVTDGQRMILPAFGAYAGGLNVCDAAFKPLFPKGFTAHLIGDGRLFAIGKAMLCRD